MSEWFEIKDQDDVELSGDGRKLMALFNTNDQGNQYVEIPIKFILALIKGTMKIKCCSCGADLGTKPCEARHDGKTSHGYCPECAKKLMPGKDKP